MAEAADVEGTILPDELIAKDENPRFPPFSGATCRSRPSQSPTYKNTSLEWYWRLSPALPELWLRDCHKLTPGFVKDLEEAWKDYQTLNIAGNGDGSGSSAWTLEGRKRLKAEYKSLAPNVKKAKEVALARHESFAIVVGEGADDWTLDYHVDFPEGKGNLQGKRKGAKGKHGVCTVM
jgi:hypothetical protein